MRAWAVVVAGGTGSRFGGPKQFAELAGRPVIEWSIETARRACDGVVVVLPADRVAHADPRWKPDSVVAGGATRSASVRAGLDAVPPGVDIIAIHDAARPLAPLELWEAVLGAIRDGADAAIPGAPVTDTVKQVGADGHLVTLDRTRLVAVQTPQAFRGEVIREVHRHGGEATDDAALVEAAGGRVHLVAAPPANIKITAPDDLLVAAALLAASR